MSTDVEVHQSHCCSLHGCKYGDKRCPVANRHVLQEYPCEYCDEDEEDERKFLESVPNMSNEELIRQFRFAVMRRNALSSEVEARAFVKRYQEKST